MELGRILFISKESPYQNEKTMTLINMALAALEEGHQVVIFMYMDGVYGAFREQHLENGKPISDLFSELIKKGAEIHLCGECANTRGLKEGRDFIEGVNVGGLYTGFVIPLEGADRVINL